jgi:glucose-1-phosphate thymidylyltransferase
MTFEVNEQEAKKLIQLIGLGNDVINEYRDSKDQKTEYAELTHRLMEQYLQQKMPDFTSVNNAYLEAEELNVVLLGRGMAWLDTGTPEGMLKAAEYVEAVQSRQGFYISCIEEIAWRRGFIGTEQLRKIGEGLKMTDYGQYLLSLTEKEK